jgi:putative transposase
MSEVAKTGSNKPAVADSDIKELRTPYRAARANGVCERFMGSLRRECLDHTIILHGRHLMRVAREYTNYFKQERPHQGIGQLIPNFYDQSKERSKVRITSKVILWGLHHSYSRVIYLN